MTQYNRLLPVPACYGFVMGKLMQWILGKLAMGKLLTCCRLAMGKLPTSYRLTMDLSSMTRTCYGLVSDTMGKLPTCYGLATEKLVLWNLAMT